MTKDGPTVLWIAESMASHHTGMRPVGESVKLHGAWWKIESWSFERIQQHIIDQNTINVITLNGTATTWSNTFAPYDALKELTKAIDKALKSGVTCEQISTLVNTRIVVTTMED